MSQLIDRRLECTSLSWEGYLSSVVEGLFEGLSDGGGDQVANDLWIEVIDLDVQLWEGGFDEGFEVGFED